LKIKKSNEKSTLSFSSYHGIASFNTIQGKAFYKPCSNAPKKENGT